MNEDNKSETKYVMVDTNPSMEEDKIDLLELIRTLLQSWKLIMGITIISTGLAVTYALFSPEVFEAETLLVPVQEEKSGTSSPLSQFGGLSAMAGVSIPGDSGVEQVVATLNSRRFLRLFIEKKNLLTVLFEEMWDDEKQVWLVESSDDEPTILDAITTFQKGVLSVGEDKKSRLITLSVLWKDPETAAEWANDLVKQLNQQLREQAIQDSRKRIGYLEEELTKTTLKDMHNVLYNLLESEKQKAMLANVNEDFALEVIDPAVAPEVREKPKRKLIVVLGGVGGGFLGVFAVFFLQFLEKLKSSGKEKTNLSHV
ncbi:MAG: hypothetical protein HOH25_08250 [Opitutae bacterium]|jgi:uncharacterized protein involved in exopolysaccharide biosynthesis|nr:hypothetical protein [Opitutae bacterium]